MLFALLLIPLFGVAALVIDLGFARLTYLQMRTAADTAALEGLRFRDDATVPEADRDAARRVRASAVVGSVFDDDLDPSAASGDALNYGAGPVVAFDGGIEISPGFTAGPVIGDRGVYEPTSGDRGGEAGLELNVGNSLGGDLVAVVPDILGRLVARDGATDPDAVADAPFFLARLRRTGAADAVARVASSGPRLPALFSRVLPLFEEADDGSLDPSVRVRGVGLDTGGPENAEGGTDDAPVSPSLATGRPAVSVGVPDAAAVLVGGLPFAIRDADAVGSLTLAFDADGTVRRDSASGPAAGLVIDDPAASSAKSLGPVAVTDLGGGLVSVRTTTYEAEVAVGVGFAVAVFDNAAPLVGDGSRSAFLPVLADGTDDLIGFVPAVMPASQPVDGTLRVDVGPGVIAAENASAVPVAAVGAAAFGLHFGFAYRRDAAGDFERDARGDFITTDRTLLAPVLVR